MKISHEIPKQLFPYNGLINDYPYVLGHLMTKDKGYADFYTQALKTADFSILDNSAFELGASIDPGELVKLARELKPKVLVLPDTLHDKEKTLKDSLQFFSNYGTGLAAQEIQCMGVLQGNSIEDLLDCWRQYKGRKGLNWIAIPFDCIKDSDWHTIRIQLWQKMVWEMRNDGPTIRYHFLGLQNPSELLCYTSEELKMISSIDTSSPIINGWKGIRYTDNGLSTPKPTEKLADNLDITIPVARIEDIIYNVKKFKSYVERKS